MNNPLRIDYGASMAGRPFTLAALGARSMTLDNHPKRVLIVEDQALVSMLVEDELTEAGYAIVGPFSTCADALSWMRHDTPDLAILDVHLRDGPCTELALELQARQVGFAVFSGAMKTHAAAIFQDAPWIEKPARLHQLTTILAGLEQRAGSASVPSYPVLAETHRLPAALTQNDEWGREPQAPAVR
jgi:DNA-binding response OmpR family regulator